MSQNHEDPLVTIGRVNAIKRRAKSKFDAERLRQMIKEGKTVKEMMAELDINHLQILKAHILKLSVLDSQYYEVVGLYKNNTRKAFVNAKGEIKIKNNMVNFRGLELIPDKTEFDVDVDPEKGQIILTILRINPVDNKINRPLQNEDTVNPEFYVNHSDS